MRSRAEAEGEGRRFIRRSSGISSWDRGALICHLALFVLPLALLWRPLFAGEAFFWGTPLLQFVPWQRLAADLWRSGHLPLWNPLVGCGAPLAANYQTAAFYPLNALYLLMPAETALSWTVALHLAMAGWGLYRWARAVGLDRFPALIGGLALQGSGFLVSRAALFPSIAITFPWIPVWLWRAEVLVQSGWRHSESSGGKIRNTLWLGLTIGLGLLAGHAQTAFYGGLLAAFYAAFRLAQNLVIQRENAPCEQQRRGGCQWLTRYALRTTGRLLVSSILGVGLASVQLLPTAELLLHSQRATGVSESFAMTYSFWPWRLITAVAPGFFGNPGVGNYWGYGTYWEDALYVGLLPLLLAVRAVIQGCAKQRQDAGAARRHSEQDEKLIWLNDERADSHNRSNTRMPDGRAVAQTAGHTALIRFWAIAVILALLFALGKNTPVFLFLFRHIPSFDLFQAPARWLAVVTVAVSGLAAMGADCWPRGRRADRLGSLGATVGGALLAGGLAAPSLVSNIPSTFGPATVRLGIGLVVTGVLTLFHERSRRRQRGDRDLWQAAIIAFIAVDLLAFGWPLVPSVDRSLYRGETETATVLSRDRAQARVYWPTDPDHREQSYDAQYRAKFDYLTFDDFGPQDADYWRGMRRDQLPNAGMLDGTASANNFDPLLVGSYVDLLETAVETPRLLRAMGVTHVATDASWSQGERIHTTGSASFYRLPEAPGRAWIVPQAREVSSEQMVREMRSRSFDPTRTVLVEKMQGKEKEGQPHRPARSSAALQDGPNQVTIRAVLDAPGYLVLADVWYPGWRASVDSEPAELLRANHAFRAVRLAAGEHTIEMTYRPTSVYVGGGITLTSVAVLIVGIFISRRQKL